MSGTHISLCWVQEEGSSGGMRDLSRTKSQLLVDVIIALKMLDLAFLQALRETWYILAISLLWFSDLRRSVVKKQSRSQEAKTKLIQPDSTTSLSSLKSFSRQTRACAMVGDIWRILRWRWMQWSAAQQHFGVWIIFVFKSLRRDSVSSCWTCSRLFTVELKNKDLDQFLKQTPVMYYHAPTQWGRAWSTGSWSRGLTRSESTIKTASIVEICPTRLLTTLRVAVSNWHPLTEGNMSLLR